MMRAQEIHIETGGYEARRFHRSDAPSPRSIKSLNRSSQMRPCMSAKQIITPARSSSKLSESFAAGNVGRKYGSVSPGKRSAGKSGGKENVTRGYRTAGTGVCITSSCGKLPTFGGAHKRSANPGDPFQALIFKAQKELDQCASWANKKVVDCTRVEGLADEGDSVANTVREARDQPQVSDIKCSDETIRAELEKWKEFGYLLAESYDQLKKNCNREIEEHGRNRQIIQALKEQVGKLKDILKHVNKENDDIRSELADEENIREQFVANKAKLEAALEEVRTGKREREKLTKQLNAVEKEREILSNEKILNSKLVQQLSDKIKVSFPPWSPSDRNSSRRTPRSEMVQALWETEHRSCRRLQNQCRRRLAGPRSSTRSCRNGTSNSAVRSLSSSYVSAATSTGPTLSGSTCSVCTTDR